MSIEHDPDRSSEHVVSVRSRLRFPLLFSLRSHLLHEPFLSAITVLAIGLSVALAVAMQMSSAAIRAELTRTAEALIGAAQIEVTSGKVGIPERLLGEVAQVEGVRSAAPIIETTVRLMGEKAEGLALHILGVDFLADREVRQYTALRGELAATDPLRLAVTPDAVIVSYRLADQLGLSERDAFEVWTSQGRKRLTVRGIFQPGGVSDAYGRQLLVMDVYSLQTLLGREGWLDRVDIVLDREAELEAVREAVVARVAGRAEVRRPRNRDQFVEAVMSTLVLITNAFAVVAVIAAGLVAFGSAYVSVERRTRTFALLRAAGLRGSQLRRLVYLDALVVGVLGTGLGLFIGWTLSGPVFGMFTTMSEYHQAGVAPSLVLTRDAWMLAVAIGLGVSLVGAVVPAQRAASQRPLSALAVSRSLKDPSRRVSLGSALFAFGLLLTWIGVWLLTDSLPAVVRAGFIFGVGLLAFVVASGVLITYLSSAGGPILERIGGGVGRFICGSLRLRLAQSRMAVGAISGVVAVVTTVWVLLSSAIETIQAAQTRTGETSVTSGDLFESDLRIPIPQEVTDKVAGTPGVRAVFRHYRTDLLLESETVAVSAVDALILGENSRWSVLEGGDSPKLARAMARGEVTVDQVFAHRFGLGVGDAVTLPTHHGPVSFPIAGIIERYGFGRGGSVRMDIAVFDNLWTRPGSSNLLIWIDGEISEVISRIRERVGLEQPLFFATPEELEEEIREILLGTSVVLYGLMVLTLLLGGIAVLSLLASTVSDQRRDFALLSANGYTGAQLVGTVIYQGLAIAALGAVAGLALGAACALAFIGVFGEMFGWLIRARLYAGELLFFALSACLAGGLAGLVPALMALRPQPTAVLAPE